MYRCCCCATPLFDTAAKSDSGTREPSFREPPDSSHVVEEDDSLWIRRNEVMCAAHDAHLGHTLDGTPPKEPRYSMNSAAQVLNEEVQMDIEVIDSWTVA